MIEKRKLMDFLLSRVFYCEKCGILFATKESSETHEKKCDEE